jgi:3-deoxy-manno-octulosonate cytidylyltransferase (CMP-KDO synthetase)
VGCYYENYRCHSFSFGSTRFPGKPLALIAGKPLVQWVVEQCSKAPSLSDVIVATDDERIRSAVAPFCEVVMTSSHHSSGTDRIEEVVKKSDADLAINIQGDEPLIDPAVIEAVAALLRSDKVAMSTAATPITSPRNTKTRISSK